MQKFQNKFIENFYCKVEMCKTDKEMNYMSLSVNNFRNVIAKNMYNTALLFPYRYMNAIKMYKV